MSGAVETIAPFVTFDDGEADTLDAPGDGFVWLDALAIAAPVEARLWLVEALGWAPGRPAMLAGYNGSGKTMVAMAAALDLLAGRSVWGEFRGREVRRIVHLNYDQGANGTRLRYQALARGHGVDLAALGDRLRLANSPSVNLTDRDAREHYLRAFEGADLAICDALRGLIGGADENASDVRAYIDVLRGVSDETGCTPLVPVHAKKKGADGWGDPREALRGSSAIMDAAGAVLLVEGRGTDPRSVHHIRQHEGALGEPLEPFYLALVREPGDALRVEYRTREQVKVPGKAGARFEALREAVVHVVREAGSLPSRNAICARVVGGAKGTKLEAIRELLDEHRLVEVGGGIRAV